MTGVNDYVIQKGHLDVGDGHQLYFEDWGNPDAFPIFHLHGGPGAGFSDEHKYLYNPTKHRVIFHDQRGCGKSLPFRSTEHNTTDHLISDIEKLRVHLGIEKMYLAGGSWGSCLSLLYAIKHPERVERMALWALFLARQSEVDFVNEGHQRHFFPEAWKRFISMVPEGKRGNGNEIMAHYAEMIRSDDPEEAKRYALEWNHWEMSILTIRYNPARIDKEAGEDEDSLAIAKLETHYFLNHCFIPENYILDNLDRIRQIPATLVHGRFDMCTPPYAAHDLETEYGKNLNMIWVNAGHSTGDPEMNAALRATALAFLV